MVELSRATLQRYGLGVTDIRTAIERQSIEQPAGSVESGEGHITLRIAGQRQTPREFEALTVISGESGGAVRLGDIATIRQLFERPEQKILFNGQRAAYLEIAKNYTQDSLRVKAAIDGHLTRERRLA